MIQRIPPADTKNDRMSITYNVWIDTKAIKKYDIQMPAKHIPFQPTGYFHVPVWTRWYYGVKAPLYIQ